jgi:hypothetical protein
LIILTIINVITPRQAVFEDFIDIAQIVVGANALEAVGIGKVFNGEGPVGGTAHREVIAVVPGFTFGQVFGILFVDGGILIVLSHDIGEFGKAILGDKLGK